MSYYYNQDVGSFLPSFRSTIFYLWWVYEVHLCFETCLEGDLSKVLVGVYFYFSCHGLLDQRAVLES